MIILPKTFPSFGVLMMMLRALFNMKVEKPPMDKSGSLYTVCAVLSYCGGKVEMYTCALTVEAEIFGLFTVGSHCLRQMKVVCLNVVVNSSQSTSLKLIMTQVLTLKFCLTSTDWV